MKVPLRDIAPGKCFRTPYGSYIRLAGIGFGENSSEAITRARLNVLIATFNEEVAGQSPRSSGSVVLAIEIRGTEIYRIRPAVLDASMSVTPITGKPYHPPRVQPKKRRR